MIVRVRLVVDDFTVRGRWEGLGLHLTRKGQSTLEFFHAGILPGVGHVLLDEDLGSALDFCAGDFHPPHLSQFRKRCSGLLETLQVTHVSLCLGPFPGLQSFVKNVV
jgi:hypothetical protein